MSNNAFLPRATATLTLSDGAQIILRVHGPCDKPRLALSHGNGLAIAGYAAFWEQLCTDFEVVLFDLRNHGQNPPHDPDQHHWNRMYLDMGEIRVGIDREFGGKPTGGVFHSMSAVAALLSSTSPDVDPGGHFDALVLFDPPIYPPLDHALHQIAFAGTENLAQLTARRPTHYNDPSELAAQFRHKSEFKQWVERAPDDMAGATLISDPNCDVQPRWKLACPRELESAMYATNRDPVLWNRLLKSVRTPFLVIGADPTLKTAHSPALVCQALSEASDINYEYVSDTSHFLQIENPVECCARVRDFMLSRLC